MAVKIATTQDKAITPTWWQTMNYGAFIQYAYGAPKTNESIYPNGALPASVSELCANFDVTDFVTAMVNYGVQYVIFNAWHIAMNALYPSSVITAVGTASATDVIHNLSVALKAQGIKLLLYVHFTDYTDLTTAQKAQIGAVPYNYATYNAFIQSLAAEVSSRYGNLVDGFWIDMVCQADFSMVDAARLRANLLKGNPNRIIIGNDSQNFDTPSQIGSGVADFLTREYYPSGSALGWSATGHQAIPIFSNTGQWWSTHTSGSGDVTRDTAANLFQWIVMQISTGGLAWGLAPYVGTSGTLFEDGVDAKMKAIWALISPIKASLIGVQTSPSFYPLRNQWDYRYLSSGDQYNVPTGGNGSKFVATLAANGQTDYVHVLTAPSSGKTITLPTPVDGATFSAATNLRTGNPCSLVTNGDHTITITLNASDSWDANDTVIALTPTSVRPTLTNPIVAQGSPALSHV